MISSGTESQPSPRKPAVFLLVSNLTPIGGAERQALYYAKIIEEKGFRVAVLARQIDEQHLAACGPGITARRDILVALRANPGCVLVSFLAADHVFCAALKMTGLFSFRWLPFERTHPDYYWMGLSRSSGFGLRLKRFGLKMAYGLLANAVLVQTRSAAQSWRQILRRFPAKPVRVIPNAFRILGDSANVGVIDGRPVRICMVGRLIAAKDYSFAIGVAAALRERGVAFEFTVIGTGELKDQLANEVNQRKLDGHFNFAGLVRNAGMTLPGYDLFLMTSRVEGMPNALGEAMACGLPCLTLDFNAGPRDLLGFENPEGRQQIVTERDIERFTDRLCTMIGDQSLRSRLGAYNRRRITSEFSSERIAGSFEAALLEQIAH